ncbi:unnamed protein product, partial [Ectocarpus sp. 8 AP-2014]
PKYVHRAPRRPTHIHGPPSKLSYPGFFHPPPFDQANNTAAAAVVVHRDDGGFRQQADSNQSHKNTTNNRHKTVNSFPNTPTNNTPGHWKKKTPENKENHRLHYFFSPRRDSHTLAPRQPRNNFFFVPFLRSAGSAMLLRYRNNINYNDDWPPFSPTCTKIHHFDLFSPLATVKI